MNDNCCINEKPKFTDYLKRYYYSFWLWVYLYIWCRYCYRHVMKLLHKFNLHYAPPTPITMDEEGKELKYSHHWCQWCGLRGDILKIKTIGEDYGN